MLEQLNTSNYLNLEQVVIDELESFVNLGMIDDFLQHEDPYFTLLLHKIQMLEWLLEADRSTEGKTNLCTRILDAVETAYESYLLLLDECLSLPSPEEL
jgi:hypothetical protein